MRTKKLKCWNGTLVIGGKDVHVNVCAYSQADVAVLLQEYGYWGVTAHYVRAWWSDCWGNSMDGIALERGVWVEFEYGVPTRLILAAGEAAKEE